ncbi:type II CRISPR-associated endonuclease Cas1 [Nitratifractor salsuginis]|uniref:CRISPR-associated endonuclease Cas1 n=1 Tax=Nitratifractor salsuginis (strain DSM 16511 / JCM 12458 / E9I37-1) TaxID=749222 RepID=E6WZT0_NITSE|nr:type II CRISPR-associated endonuclease Cas1 [Nitratifractor salsuginis]ADV46721.1 CRISPR-associated protein Cas1 [Nitratifractor salsuginis DSM 16511]
MAAWKTIRITKPCRLSIENGNLVVEDEKVRFKLSLSDTDSIIFEGDRFTLSAKVLAALSRHKVATLFCDEYYMPTAILHPYHQSSLATETLKAQLSLPDDLRDRLWQEIIRVKILNQSAVLSHFAKKNPKLERYAEQIRPGDPYRTEAKSARLYWNKLFDGLKREADSLDVRNQALNYAYAILRSLITRDLSAAGFLPALGLWHDNRYNAFNLSDDLMEPFRPIVDAAVYLLLPLCDEEYLTPEFKKAIISIFDSEYLIYDAGRSTLRTVATRYIQGFKAVVRSRKIENLHFPTIDFGALRECF